MSPHASLSCSSCGRSLLEGALVCPHDGTPAPEAAPAPRPPSDKAAHLDVLVGQQLGEYLVRRYIGSGGMGVVYEGQHLTIGRRVAIKFIREELAADPHARGLLAEARAASAIRHHGIIDIFGFGQHPGLGQYLVMEYLEGRPLNELIQERAPLPLTQALMLLCEVLEALSAAHAEGVIHRDIKPNNIFVVRQSNGTEHIKVLDFGLAKRSATPEGTTPQTNAGMLVGTPQYMAPEQVLGDAVGPRTDLYAVGVIAFELLTGRRPFPGRSTLELVNHHLNTAPPAPSSLVQVPPEVDALVLRLLAKEPKQRPASANEVAHQLRALLQPREGRRSSERSSGAIPEPRPSSDAVAAHSPTVTMPPALGSGGPVVAASPRLLARASRWKLGTALAALFALVLGAGVLMRRGPSHASAPLPNGAFEAVLTLQAPSVDEYYRHDAYLVRARRSGMAIVQAEVIEANPKGYKHGYGYPLNIKPLDGDLSHVIGAEYLQDALETGTAIIKFPVQEGRQYRLEYKTFDNFTPLKYRITLSAELVLERQLQP